LDPNNEPNAKEVDMHIQIVNYHLKGLTDGDHSKLCEQLAPSFAALPGLVSKVWLANPATNTYGGIYTWRDRDAMIAFTKSELFASVVNSPNLVDIKSSDFAVAEAPSRVTRGLTAVAV
jgi:hypothetical protein